MNITELFKKSAENLKWPRIVFPLPNGGRIQFSLAGPNAKFPGTLNITDGGSYENNTFFGRVLKDNTINWARYGDWSETTKEQIRKLVNEPINECKVYGQQHSWCCFCGTEITSKSSLAVGYGPICAENWGLPWGIEEDKVQTEFL